MNRLWMRHDAEWRDPAQITSQWKDASDVNPALLRHTVRGDWWDVLASRRLRLIVTREYEHLVLSLGAPDGRPSVTFTPLPHPSGVAVDQKTRTVHIASTRNPNQVFDFAVAHGLQPRLDLGRAVLEDRPLVPVRSRFYPGCLYLHDLAYVGGDLHATAVGENAIVRLTPEGSERVWWPRCVDAPDGPLFGRNHIQLNSIAAGRDVHSSYYSASSDEVTSRRPGHRNFPVDRRGVIFSGRTREPVVRGLTRPHSARLHRNRLWVDNSGYGEVGYGEEGRLHTVARLPGWTRGLALHRDLAFVGTSRVIPRFRAYAPGLDVGASVCAVHAVDLRTGSVLGSIVWPKGNQVFAIECVDQAFTTGFAFRPGARRMEERRRLFYAFSIRDKRSPRRPSVAS